MDQDARVTGLRIERSGPVLTVAFDNPDRRNAQVPSTWHALAQVETLVDDSVRVVVVRGDGADFSAGLDLRLLAPGGLPGERSPLDPGVEPHAFIRDAQAGFRWWSRADVVTVALVQGNAIGAGFQLALACDLRVLDPGARFAMRETSLGLVPDLGGTGPLVEAIGYSRALEVCATGRFVSADEAHQWGLANAIVPQSEWETWLANALAPILSADRGAVAELKALLRGATPDDEQWDREREAQVRRLSALAAFLATASRSAQAPNPDRR